MLPATTELASSRFLVMYQVYILAPNSRTTMTIKMGHIFFKEDTKTLHEQMPTNWAIGNKLRWILIKVQVIPLKKIYLKSSIQNDYEFVPKFQCTVVENVVMEIGTQAYTHTGRQTEWIVVPRSVRPRQNRHNLPDDSFSCIFVNENVWISIKFSPKFFSQWSN